MNLGSHLEELRRKHQNLSDQVEAVQKSPAGDDLQVMSLKKEKLKIKEEIARLVHA